MFPYKNRTFFLKLALFAAFLVSFSLVFQENRFDTADRLLFERFANGTESFVINRIAVSEKFGISSYAGFTGRILNMDNTRAATIKVQRGRSVLDSYYEKFYETVTQDNFKPYKSNLALQARALSFIKTNDLLAAGENFSNYRLIFSITSAFIFSCLILFIVNEFGFFVAIATGLMIFQLDWIVASASHFFWFSGLMFAPFVFNLLSLRSKSTFSGHYLAFLFLMNSSLSFLKCITSGYEVIPSFLVMTCMPAFYFWVRHGWRPWVFVIVFAVISSSSLAGVGLSMYVQAERIDILQSRDGAGKDYLLSSFTRRSSGADEMPANLPKHLVDSYRISSLDVVKRFVDSQVITKNSHKRHSTEFLESDSLLYSLIVMTVFVLIAIRSGLIRKYRSRVSALCFVAWLSIISPISMFVIFKSLSWLHPFLVPITWNMPFSILIICLFFYMIRLTLASIWSLHVARRVQTPSS